MKSALKVIGAFMLIGALVALSMIVYYENKRAVMIRKTKKEQAAIAEKERYAKLTPVQKAGEVATKAALGGAAVVVVGMFAWLAREFVIGIAEEMNGEDKRRK